MERTKFNGFIYNGNKYPDGWLVPGGHLAYPSETCEMKHKIFKYDGLPIIDYGCCTMICQKKCYRFHQWKEKRYAEYRMILTKYQESKNQ